MGENGDRERSPLSFPHWNEALEATALAPADKQAHALGISEFLGFGKRRHAPASIILIKEYLTHLGEQEANTARRGRAARGGVEVVS